MKKAKVRAGSHFRQLTKPAKTTRVTAGKSKGRMTGSRGSEETSPTETEGTLGGKAEQRWAG